MTETVEAKQIIDLKTGVADIIALIDQEREREIITRRFGLYDRRETLEQIGELLGITRERVRQLEKAILIRLKIAAEDGKTDTVAQLEKAFIRALSEMGRAARISDLADKLYDKPTNQQERAHVAFIATLAPNLTVIDENDNYHQATTVAEYGDEKKLKARVDEIVAVIKEAKEPQTVDQLYDKLSYEHPAQVAALASISKQLAHLRDSWGLTKWPTVNPKNIRDKIYVILADNKKPMHFSEIAKSIKGSSFKRKDVTTQAIHNELIKDKRFVLIGRGIYALDNWGYSKGTVSDIISDSPFAVAPVIEGVDTAADKYELIKDKRFVLIGRGIYALDNWGYSKGTVSDIISDVLKKAGEPLHRDEIVKRVLKSRQVKETTILLNLQSKSQFKRVAKATYVLADEK